MSKYKTFEELKEELGDNYDLFMYEINLSLLQRLDKAIELTKNLLKTEDRGYYQILFKEQLKVLGDEE